MPWHWLGTPSARVNSISSNNQLVYFPDARKIIPREFLIEIKQMIFEIIQINTLRPMI